jgi:hypothetical protein
MDRYDVAVELRDLFVEHKCKPRPDGTCGRYTTHAFNLEDFKKAADVCIALQARPTEFVEAIFFNKDPFKIFPSHLYGKTAGDCYKTYIDKLQAVSYRDRLALNKRWFQEQLAMGFSEESILLTSWIPFDPWFRVCISKKPIASVIKKWHGAAEEQLTQRLIDFLKTEKLDYTRI